MTITRAEAREIRLLLGKFQCHLEGAIESCIPRPIPDEDPERIELLLKLEVKDEYAPDIELDRQDWRRAENWVKKLEQAG